MNKSEHKTQKHRCITANTSISRCNFCRICGVYMSMSTPKSIYYRSAKYNTVDPFRLDSNMVLSELIKKQSQNRYYNTQAHHLGYRNELIGFVEEISLKLEYSETTFHLALGMLDAILSLYAIDKKQLKMVCFMALNLAAKMEENNSKIPELNAIAQLFENKFDLEDLANCEVLLAKVLGYNMNIKTPYTFITHFLSKGVVSDSDIGRLSAQHTETKMIEFEKLVLLFLQISNTYYEFYQFTSIAVATSVIACARRLSGFDLCWTHELENLTHVTYSSIKQCCALLYETAQEQYPVLTPHIALGTSIDEFDFAVPLNGLKSRGSMFTVATSEKDEHYQMEEFHLSDSENEELNETKRFVLPYDLNAS